MSFSILFNIPSCPHCTTCRKSIIVIDSTTYNLLPMYELAGWWKEPSSVLSGTKTSALVPTLKAAIKDMKDRESVYRKLNPPNGWGNYEDALQVTEQLLEACVIHPDGFIELSL